MILTIDTEKDSAQRLRQAADFLRRLAGDSAYPEPVRSEPVEPSPGMLNMFDTESEPAPAPERTDVRIEPY